MVIITVLGYILLGIYEFVPLYKEGKWAEFKVNLGLGIVSFTVAVLLSLDVKIPSPGKPIAEFYTQFDRKVGSHGKRKNYR